MSQNYGPPGSRCLFCGKSTVPRTNGRRGPIPKLRSFELTQEYMAANPPVQAYANHLGKVDQIETSSRICRPCVQRAVRYEQKQARLYAAVNAVKIFLQSPPSESLSDGHASDLLSDDEDIPQEVPLEAPGEVPVQAPEDQLDDVEAVPQKNPGASVPAIPLPGYSRLSSTATYCIVAGCNVRNNLHSINALVRSSILQANNIYIPVQSRICTEHLKSNEIWQDFANRTRQRRDTFKPMQLSSMLKLLRRYDYIDFERLETIDESTFQFFIGLDKEKFMNILEGTPSLQQLQKPKRALATVLCKLNTGDSNERLSNIFRMTPMQFSSVMKIVRLHLLNGSNRDKWNL